MIRLWRAYSCNNSSSYRLVARFADPRVARETAAELAAFLIEHTRQTDGRWVESDASIALAKRYGFTWTELLAWSTQLEIGDEPEVAVDGGTLVVFHRYCLGFGDLDLFLTAKGAIVEAQDWQAPPVSVLFRAQPGANPRLDAELATMFSVNTEHQPFDPPWRIETDTRGRYAFFRDAGTVGMWFPLAPSDLPELERWLAKHGIEQPAIRLCEYGDEKIFAAIATARCTACSGPLEYLDPRVHDIETPQLVCRPCGGLYDLSAFL